MSAMMFDILSISFLLGILDGVSTELRSSMMFLAGIALITMLLVRRTYRQFGRGRARLTGGRGPAIEAQPRPANSWDGSHRDAAARIQRQQVELEEMSRDVNGLLNSKIMMLERLIETSSDQIQEMERLLAELREAKDDVLAMEQR